MIPRGHHMQFLLFWATGVVRGDATSLAVLDFKPLSDVDTISVGGSTNGLRGTREIAVCFRFLTQFNPSFFLITTSQFNIWLKHDKGFVYMKSRNATTKNEEYCRMFPYCQKYVPGHWMSVCLSIKLKGQTQEITFSQEGQICAQKSYLDGDFEWMYVKPTIFVNDM